MTTAAKTRKPPWTLAEWLAFCQRCREFRDRVDRLVESFPGTMGRKASHTDALLKIRSRALAAMIGMEDVIERQHPATIGVSMGIIHSSGSCSTLPPGPVVTRPTGEPLSRVEWLAWGAELKAIRDEANALVLVYAGTIGATRAKVRLFEKTAAAISSARCKLDSLVHQQHPGWGAAAKVFYGPVDQL